MVVFRWMVLPVLAVCAFTAWLYVYVYRGTRFFLKKYSKMKQRILAVLITVLLIVPVRFSLLWFIFLAHFSVLLLLTELIFFTVSKIRKKELEGWLIAVRRSGIPALMLAAAVLGYGSYNMHHIVKTGFEVSTDKKLRTEGYKIALIADLHYGISLEHDGLAAVVEEIGKEKPDVVVLDGDIVDERTTKEQMEDAFATLGKISSTYGVFYVYGNHDKNFYSSSPDYTVEQLEAAVQEAGITILEDDAAKINSELVLLGRADRSYAPERMPVAELAAGQDENSVLVVLDHQPTGYDEIREAGCDMVLSGHTHAGQIWPLGLFARLFHLDEMSYGYEKADGLNMLVTSGMAGWGVPIRTQKHSEYMVITLKNKE